MTDEPMKTLWTKAEVPAEFHGVLKAADDQAAKRNRLTTVTKTLQHARARFKCLADEFEKSGDTASWAMCKTDAEMMDRALTAALSDQAGVEQFILDMADSVNEVVGTARQKEIFKASLRLAISHARRKAAQRLPAPPSPTGGGE